MSALKTTGREFTANRSPEFGYQRALQRGTQQEQRQSRPRRRRKHDNDHVERIFNNANTGTTDTQINNARAQLHANIVEAQGSLLKEMSQTIRSISQLYLSNTTDAGSRASQAVNMRLMGRVVTTMASAMLFWADSQDRLNSQL